jgi:hypothetical protein
MQASSTRLPAQRDLRLGQGGLRLLVVVPQLEQQLPLLDLVAFLDAEVFDAPADDGRQLGALAGFDGAGAGVGQRGLDLARRHFLDDDRHRLGPVNQNRAEPEQGRRWQDDGNAAHGRFLTKTG